MKYAYEEDVIEDLLLAIEQDALLRHRYDELSAELRPQVVNNWIGQYTKQMVGMESIRQVNARRSKLIKSYTKLGRIRI
jgi:hypothetical protein